MPIGFGMRKNIFIPPHFQGGGAKFLGFDWLLENGEGSWRLENDKGDWLLECSDHTPFWGDPQIWEDAETWPE